MQGIYKFTNKTNFKSYVGKSQDLEKRYNAHKNNHFNENCSGYNTKFYRALRKYGFENFEYEILESFDWIDESELNEKEKYYISFYDCINNGYNIQPGGENTCVPRKLSEERVLEIKEALKNSDIPAKDLADKYGVQESMISLINKGKNWTFVGEYSYPIRVESHNHRGSKNPKAKITDEQVIALREYFVSHTLQEVYEKFGQNHSFSEIKKICYGSQFTHLPIYKKRQDQWYLNGSCIDYPREVE